MQASSYVVWNKDTTYHLFIQVSYFVPTGGRIKIVCPPEIDIEKNANPVLKIFKGTIDVG